MVMFGPANQVTAARALLVVVMAALAVRPAASPTAFAAAALGVAVVLLDGVDGWIARRSGTASAFGARFDMEVDAVLILVLAALAWQHGKAGAWILLAGLLRYLFVAAGSLSTRMRRPLPESRRRKVLCIVQAASLIVIVLPAVRPPASVWIAALSLAALCYSFLVDTLWLLRHRSA
jgi:phosphatidylglycerophosphate synthase